ncbi:MAG: SpvB/TcaC N-terminal domain-containing protein, partial [Leptospirales bacterium]
MFQKGKIKTWFKTVTWIILIHFISPTFAPVFAQSQTGTEKRLQGVSKQIQGEDKEQTGTSDRPGKKKGKRVAYNPDNDIIDKVEFRRTRLEIPRGALKQATKIGIRPLLENEVPGLKGGMNNVTDDYHGYEFTPHGTAFQKPVRVVMPYDPRFIPEGYAEENIFTFYYEEERQEWIRLKRLKVDKKNQVIISMTTHFTKMVNSTLSLPESPKPQAFNPNTIKDIKAADPSAGIAMIEPPKANSNGSNSLQYPIQLPPGRAGVAPQLGISYSNSAAQTWLGAGFDLSVPSIGIDTRFGVPRYTGSETYTLNGSELVKIGTSNGASRYRMRVEGAYQKIERYGGNTGNYYWVVVDKNGTKMVFGKSENSRLKSYRNINGHKPVFKWNLEKTIDTNGNTISYTYFIDKESSNYSKEPYRQIYLSNINYTGTTDGENTTSGKYNVDFIRETRPDKRMDAKSGFKIFNRYRLSKIEVKFESEIIRKYKLSYSESNSSKKSLLTKITNTDADDKEFFKYTFEYFDLPKQSSGYKAFGNSIETLKSPMKINANYTEPDLGTSGQGFGSFLSNVKGANDPTFATSYSTSASFSYSLGFYFGIKSAGIGVGVSVGQGAGRNNTLFAMRDINGDNLPDLLYKNQDQNKFKVSYQQPGNTYGPVENFDSPNFKWDSLADKVFKKFIKILKGPVRVLKSIASAAKAARRAVRSIPLIGKFLAKLLFGWLDSFIQSVNMVVAIVNNLNKLPLFSPNQNISVDANKSFQLSASASFTSGAGASLGFSTSKSTGEITLTDFNGDGFVDYLGKKNGKPLYYKENINGNKHVKKTLGGVFETDPIGTGEVVDSINEEFPLVDSVIAWVAPKEGRVTINGSSKKLLEGGDGVRLFIFKNDAYDDIIWQKIIGPEDTKRFNHSIELDVKPGDIIRFAANSIYDIEFDEVQWNPEIEYTKIIKNRENRNYKCDSDISEHCVESKLMGKTVLVTNRQDFYSFQEDFY